MFIIEFFRGLKAYPKANRAIFKYRLWPYLVIPGIMSCCYILLMIFMGQTYFSELAGQINEYLLPEFLRGDLSLGFTTVLLWMFLLLTAFITYQPVILVLFSPIFSYLSEITEVRIYNRSGPPFNFRDILQDIVRSLVINCRNLVRMFFFVVLAWSLVLIPVFGSIVSGILIFLIQSFYNGFSLVDYTLERKRYPVKKRILFAKDLRPRLIGVGAGFMILLFIPLLGWFAAPSYGTVAATIAALEKINGNDPQLMAL